MWKFIGALVLLVALIVGVSYKNYRSATPEHKLLCSASIDVNDADCKEVLKQCTFIEIIQYKIND